MVMKEEALHATSKATKENNNGKRQQETAILHTGVIPMPWWPTIEVEQVHLRAA